MVRAERIPYIPLWFLIGLCTRAVRRYTFLCTLLDAPMNIHASYVMKARQSIIKTSVGSTPAVDRPSFTSGIPWHRTVYFQRVGGMWVGRLPSRKPGRPRCTLGPLTASRIRVWTCRVSTSLEAADQQQDDDMRSRSSSVHTAQPGIPLQHLGDAFTGDMYARRRGASSFWEHDSTGTPRRSGSRSPHPTTLVAF